MRSMRLMPCALAAPRSSEPSQSCNCTKRTIKPAKTMPIRIAMVRLLKGEANSWSEKFNILYKDNGEARTERSTITLKPKSFSLRILICFHLALYYYEHTDISFTHS